MSNTDKEEKNTIDVYRRVNGILIAVGQVEYRRKIMRSKVGDILIINALPPIQARQRFLVDKLGDKILILQNDKIIDDRLNWDAEQGFSQWEDGWVRTTYY